MSTGDKICEHGIWNSICVKCSNIQQDMDKLKKQEENFDQFENFIQDLDPNQAKDFIIEFFKKYKYLLDNDITRVTDNILKIIQKKTIAVIGLNEQDIKEWWKTIKDGRYLGAHPRHYRKDNTTYIGITKPEHMLGFKFNDVIYTPNSGENKHIEEIIRNIVPCLISK